MILNIKIAKQQNINEKDCALICVQSLLHFANYNKQANQIAQYLKPKEFGYDIFDIANYLAYNKIIFKVGHYDTDYLKRDRGQNFHFDIKKLEYLLQKLSSKPAHIAESLKLNIDLLLKHNDLLEIKPLKIKEVIEILELKHPLMINVDLFYLNSDKDHTIHSMIIHGFSKKSFYILDPILGARIVGQKQIIKAWKQAGQYYLYINN